MSDIINIKVHETNMDGREVASAIGNVVKEMTGRAITMTIPRAGIFDMGRLSDNRPNLKIGEKLNVISASSTCSDYSCSKIRNKIFSIDTSHGYSLDFICCCQYDHQDLFHSLR